MSLQSELVDSDMRNPSVEHSQVLLRSIYHVIEKEGCPLRVSSA